jgi:hypothetical protein
MKGKIKLNPVSKKLPGELGRVQMLLKEVLQQMPEHMAERVMNGVDNGGEAHTTLRENSRGRGYKVAFTVTAMPGQPQLDNRIKKNSFIVRGEGGNA